MIEIVIVLIALVVSCLIFPRENSDTGSNETIDPFHDEEFLDDNKNPRKEFYDWAEYERWFWFPRGNVRDDEKSIGRKMAHREK